MGGAYTASLAPNFLSANTDPQSIQAATDLFEKAVANCPNTQIVAGGYRYSFPFSSAHPSVGGDANENLNTVKAPQ